MDLVGRQHELKALLELLDDAGRGRGRAVLLLGEAGIGKTRLAEALAEAAGARSFLVAWGRCAEGEVPPYWPWRQALRALSGAPSPALTSDQPLATRDALFAAVIEELEAVTRSAPAVVVVEDLHWADDPTLALLRFVAGIVPGLPVVLLVTARDDPLELGETAAATLRDLPPAVDRLLLAGLDRDATEDIVRRICGPGAPDGFVTEVHERTGGNPFFVEEVARLRASHGEQPRFAVPLGVQAVIGRRLARLSQPAHRVLGAAAVAGDELDPEMLAALSQSSVAEVVDLLDEAVRAQLVVERPGRLAFVHALVRETLYDALPYDTRSHLHRDVAEALEASAARGRPLEGLDAQLAAHWSRVPGAEARRRARTHAERAAREAAGRLGYEQAARYYRWALDADPDDRLPLLVGLGQAQMLAGEVGAGRTTLIEAAAAANAADRGQELAEAVLGMGGGTGGFEVQIGDQHQIGWLEGTLRLLPEGDSSLRAAVLARLSLTLAGVAGPERRVDLARGAVAMAERVGDAEGEVAALAAYCDAVAGPDHVAARLEATARMIDLAAAGDDPRLLLLARRMRLVTLLETGRFAEADAEAVAYAAVADRLRLALYQWPIPMWQGMRALMRGDLDQALSSCDEVIELGRRAGSVNAELMAFTLDVAHAAVTGTTARIGDRFDWALGIVGPYPVAWWMFSVVAKESRPDFARQMFDRARAIGIEAMDRDAEWLEGMWHAGEAGMLYAEPALAEAAYEALVPYDELWAIDGIGAACFGVTAHQLGRLAAFLGRTRDAEHWLRLALARHRDVGARLLTELTEWALAELEHSPAPAAPPPVGRCEFRREGALWHLRWRGQEAAVADSKGMRDLATLLVQPGREVHVLDLVEAAGAPPAAAADAGTGPDLDRAARDAYRRRLTELEEELAEAEGDADLGRSAKLREERDLLAAELGAALGLGGRPRHAGDRTERARKAVAMRIGTALRTIAAAHPALARHLEVSIATGRFCVYRPEDPVTWRT